MCFCSSLYRNLPGWFSATWSTPVSQRTPLRPSVSTARFGGLPKSLKKHPRLASGKRTKNWWENHHAINGKIHEHPLFRQGHFQVRKLLLVYQRVHESLANFHNIFLFAIILCDWLGWFTIWSPWKIPVSASSSVHMSFSRRDSLQRSTAVRALFTFDSVGAHNYSQLFPVYPSLFLQHLGVWQPGIWSISEWCTAPLEFQREFFEKLCQRWLEHWILWYFKWGFIYINIYIYKYI